MEEAVQVKWLRLDCPGVKVRVRSAPGVAEPEVSFAGDGDEFQVFAKTIKGFYQLVDGSVRYF